jgi:hypothetical protein
LEGRGERDETGNRFTFLPARVCVTVLRPTHPIRWGWLCAAQLKRAKVHWPRLVLCCQDAKGASLHHPISHHLHHPPLLQSQLVLVDGQHAKTTPIRKCVSACVCVCVCVWVWLCDLHLENDGSADATPSVVLTRGEDSIVLLPADTMHAPPFRSPRSLCCNSLSFHNNVPKKLWTNVFLLFPSFFLWTFFTLPQTYSNVCWHKRSSLAVLGTS